jgi:transposase-like protein
MTYQTIGAWKWKRITPQNFFDWVDQSGGLDSCWPWLSGQNGVGYGRFQRKKQMIYAHREAYEITYGPAPDGLYVLHRCDNRICCNPRHLFIGTHLENIADMVAKGRNAKGERSGQAKFTDEFVAEVIAAYKPGEVTQQQVADRFGMGRRHVGNLYRGEARGIPVYEIVPLRRTNTRFSNETMLAAMNAFRRGEGTKKEVAARFGMSPQHLGSALRGINRKVHEDGGH